MSVDIQIDKIKDLNQLKGTSSPDELLYSLENPTWVYLPGKTPHVRVITTLIHGNEPSGFYALWKLLHEDYQPDFSCWFLIANLPAAQAEPVFTNRWRPGGMDLNRCFESTETHWEAVLAGAILKDIREMSADLVVDIHNTSGDGPDFCVTLSKEPHTERLASYLSRRLILTEIKLGALMEAELECPIITLEAGGARSNSAHEHAYKAIKRILSTEASGEHYREPLDHYRHPERCVIRHESSLGYSAHNDLSKDLTLNSGLLSLNFGITPKGELLGWVNDSEQEIFQFEDKDHQSAFYDVFEVLDGKWFTKKAVKLFMITPNLKIAKQDCLFYFVTEYEGDD